MAPITIIADDLTGAADCGIAFAGAGAATFVAFSDQAIVPDAAQVVAIDTDTRWVAPEVARAKAEASARRAYEGDLRILYKKIDSTLRGNIAQELAGLLRVGGEMLGVRPVAIVVESDEPVADVTGILRRTGADVLVCYLPVGSQQAAEWYAERALEAGCAFVNCIPVFIGSSGHWQRRFEERRLPIVSDDIKSQVGATILHRMLATLFRERGARVDRTYQLNVGGNSDFRNMLERERVTSKRISKTNAVASQLGAPLSPDDLHVSPCDFVPWLADRKVCSIRMEGVGFGEAPISCELKLEVWDSPNSAGVVIDAVQCARLALDRGIGGALIGPSAYFMKSPPQQFTDAEARLRTLHFIEAEPRVRRAVP